MTGLAKGFALAAMTLATLFLLAPLLIIVAASFSPTPVFDLPTSGASLRWYAAIGQLDGFWPALALSLEIAALSTILSLVIGTLAAVAITRGHLPGAGAFAATLVSPLMMPGLVLGVALLQFFRSIGVVQTFPELLLAHIVVTLPYVARTMIAALSRFDFALIDAARTLGCSFPSAMTRVLAPALAPAYLTSALFAFLASMDNYPISIFLTDARSKTLPIKMLQYIEESPDPTLAALSTLILVATLALLLIADRAIGLHRMATRGVTLMNTGRDFVGYAGKPPQVHWPRGAKLAVSLVVNFEEGAEFSISDGDVSNEAIYEVEHRIEGLPDPCLDSHFEYGARAGWWRVMNLIDAHGAKATISACGRAVERTPQLAQDAIRRGHEVAAHGWRWQSHAGLSESEEREIIARTVAAITKATGKRPLGWHTRSASTPNTRRLLIEEGGFLYDSDAYNDDLPYLVRLGERAHVVLPYAFDTNDMQFQNTNRFATSSDFADYVLDAFRWLMREPAPRMMSIGLHLRMIGRPGRIAALERILETISRADGVWIARRDEIARAWLEGAEGG